MKKVGLPGYEDGTIYDKNLDGTYAIKFLDGRMDRKVLGSRIAAMPTSSTEDEGSSESKSGAPSSSMSPFKMGDKVEGNLSGRGKWYPGRVMNVNAKSGAVDVRYDDGKEESGLSDRMVRKRQPSEISAPEFGGGSGSKVMRSPRNGGADASRANQLTKFDDDINSGNSYRVSDSVEGNYGGYGKWYPGKIARHRSDGTYDISYDNGKTETRIEARLLRRKDEEKPQLNLDEGSKVEGNYRGKGKYYPGKITRVRLNGTFDISYDDGEKEIGVTRDNVRGIEIERRGMSPRADREREAASNRIEEGSKVEGNYRGKGKWFPGKITRDRGDHTFDIAYDDGESETRVDELLIRVSDWSVGDDKRRGRSPDSDSHIRRRLNSGSPDVSRSGDKRERGLRDRSRSPDHDVERSCLLMPPLGSSIQSIVRKYQSVSTDGTARKLFESVDDNPLTGFVTKKEFKKVIKRTSPNKIFHFIIFCRHDLFLIISSILLWIYFIIWIHYQYSFIYYHLFMYTNCNPANRNQNVS